MSAPFFFFSLKNNFRPSDVSLIFFVELQRIFFFLFFFQNDFASVLGNRRALKKKVCSNKGSI